ncbi:MAG: hypothetical protein LAP21_21990 [Acidobacteriia bacterium]|nr:hypothetical protein [Terriglobia bacterium]
MSPKNSEPQSFLDQVMEICDRILDQQPNAERDVRHEREDTPAAPIDGAGK